MTVINTNSRSLCPKINSLLDCFEELKGDVAVVTETWLADGEGLEEDADDLVQCADLGMLYENRAVNSKGVAHGGVAIFFKKSKLELKAFRMHNPEKFEIIPSVGRITGLKRKLVVIACYIPPNYTVPRGKAALEHIANCIIQAKRKYDDPMLVITGDFNQWGVHETMADFVDIKEVPVGPTRGDRCIDRLFQNFNHHVTGTTSPLETDDGSKKSDHRVVFASSSIPVSYTHLTLPTIYSV